jgi:hypothetical protein
MTNDDEVNNIDTVNNMPATSTKGAVSIQLPPFNRTDPVMWFAQVTHKFNGLRITEEEDKYNALATAIDGEIATTVRDLLVNKPTEAPYTTLKNALLSRIGPSLRENIRQLLATEELGDRKPSALLRVMLARSGNQATEESAFFRQLFLDKLPEQTRSIMAPMQDNATVHQLALIADNIYESGNNIRSHEVHAINTMPHINIKQQASNREPEVTLAAVFKIITDLAAKVATIDNKLQNLTSTVKNVQERGRSNQFNSNTMHVRDRSKSQNRVQNNFTIDSSTDSEICWYHEKYGEKALKCVKGCKYNASFSAQGNPNPDMQ